MFYPRASGLRESHESIPAWLPLQWIFGIQGGTRVRLDDRACRTKKGERMRMGWVSRGQKIGREGAGS